MVTLPDGTRLVLTGVVRWVREPRPGLRRAARRRRHRVGELPMDALRALLRFAELREPLLWEETERSREHDRPPLPTPRAKASRYR